MWRLSQDLQKGGAVEIKAGLMKRQLSSNNATDQGKAAEQVFFIYIFPFHGRNCT